MSVSKFRNILDKTDVADLLAGSKRRGTDDIKAELDAIVEAEVKRRMPAMSEHLATQAKVIANVDALGEHSKTKGMLESERQARAAAEASAEKERARADSAAKREGEAVRAKAEMEGRLKAAAEAAAVFERTVKEQFAEIKKELAELRTAQPVTVSASIPVPQPREKRVPPTYEVKFRFDAADRLLGADLVPK